MSQYELLKNICDDSINEFIINLLREQGSWRIAPDDYDSKISTDMAEAGFENDMTGFSDTGMLLMTYNELHDDGGMYEKFEGLNTMAQYVFCQVLKHCEHTYYDLDLVRVLWNYYNTGSTGVFHVDKDFDDSQYLSIIYQLNTCDGGTIVGDSKIITSVAGNAILIDSNLPHRGVGPKKDSQRYVLNLLLRYSEKD